MQQVVIPARFNGPPNSGNGGYSCGAVAAFIEGVATVRLHAPPPLDVALDLERLDNGGVELRRGEQLIASGRPDELDIEVPAPPSLEQARHGLETYTMYEDHPLPTCFVCGPGRPAHDGLELFTGPINDAGMVAAPWKPGEDLLDEDGMVRPEFVWSALDCPGCFAALRGEPVQVLLGQLTLRLNAPAPGDQELIVYAWPHGSEGRKYYGGTALAGADGEVYAEALTTWVALKT